MQSAHEQCFLCRRAQPDRYVYYKDYNELEGEPQTSPIKASAATPSLSDAFDRDSPDLVASLNSCARLRYECLDDVLLVNLMGLQDVATSDAMRARDGLIDSDRHMMSQFTTISSEALASADKPFSGHSDALQQAFARVRSHKSRRPLLSCVGVG